MIPDDAIGDPHCRKHSTASVWPKQYVRLSLDSRTHLYGVLGSHASLSLSPAMQNAAFQAKHVNAQLVSASEKADFASS